MQAGSALSADLNPKKEQQYNYTPLEEYVNPIG
jgi:hypothetical protein